MMAIVTDSTDTPTVNPGIVGIIKDLEHEDVGYPDAAQTFHGTISVLVEHKAGGSYTLAGRPIAFTLDCDAAIVIANAFDLL